MEVTEEEERLLQHLKMEARPEPWPMCCFAALDLDFDKLLQIFGGGIELLPVVVHTTHEEVDVLTQREQPARVVVSRVIWI